MERLDRFYVSDWAIGRGGESGVVPRTTLSNHAPVILVLDSASHSLPPRTCRIPDSIYSSAEVHSRIVELWERDWDAMGDIAAQVAQVLADSSLICQQEAIQVRQ